jgi:hypothetical protein
MAFGKIKLQCAKKAIFSQRNIPPLTIVKHYLLSLALCMICGQAAMAQNTPDSSRRPGIRMSLVTCGPGPEIYSVFGHTAIRVTDSASGSDIVYNYGTFDGYDKDFELNFMKGKLLYYLS